jgi:hypothetical protein
MLTFHTVAFAQFKLSVSAGYGTYSMKDLKVHQAAIQSQFPVDAKITSSFPGYWYYQLGGDYYFKSQYFVGASIAYGSTGGNIHYSDYSGEVGCIHKIKYVSVTFPVGWRLPLRQDKFNLQFELSPAVYSGDTRLEVETVVNGQPDRSAIEFESMNIGVQPAIRLERKAGPVLIFVEGGYYFDIYRSKLIFKDNKDFYLLTDNGEEVHADFTGLRAALGVAFAFSQ